MVLATPLERKVFGVRLMQVAISPFSRSGTHSFFLHAWARLLRFRQKDLSRIIRLGWHAPQRHGSLAQWVEAIIVGIVDPLYPSTMRQPFGFRERGNFWASR